MASIFNRKKGSIEVSNNFSNSNISLAESIKDANKALNLFLNNKFEEAKISMEPLSKTVMYHSLSYCTILYLQATITREQVYIAEAINAVKVCLNICDKNRRKMSISGSLKFRNKASQRAEYGKYNDYQSHAELCYAECMLHRALLCFLEDENLISLIKGGLKIRECYRIYKDCWKILKVKSWDDESVKSSFESGVRLGVGSFNLLISMLPTRILKLLEFIGFKGNKEFGLREMNNACSSLNNLRQPLASLMLLSYHCFVGVITGIYPYTEHIEEAKRLIAPCLNDYKNSALFVLIRSRIDYICGKFEEAITGYEEAISCQSEWKSLHDMCHWELMWSYALQRDWLIAMKYAEKLSQESKWSKATCLYQKASFLIEVNNEANETITSDMKQYIRQIFETIPKLMQRFAGKSLPVEKFAAKKSKRFLDQGEYLILPGVELVFIWNGFKTMAYNPVYVEQFLVICDKTLEHLLATTNDKSPYYYDNVALATMLKAVCLRYLLRITEAMELMNQVLEYDKKIKEDLYIIPYTQMELAQIAFSEGRYDDVKSHMEKAKSYTGYSLESRLHFRIHGIEYHLKKVLADPDIRSSANSWDSCSVTSELKNTTQSNTNNEIDDSAELAWDYKDPGIV